MGLVAQQWYLCAIATLTVFGYIVIAGTRSSRSTLPLQKQCQLVCGSCLRNFNKLLVRILKQGPIPQHVAFIMDGNRRFARKSQMASVSSGHFAGFQNLSNVLEWCKDLGIGNVSIFAFAINNFNRSPEEVSSLMELAEEKLKELADRSVAEDNRELRIRVVGNRDLLPERVVKSAEYAERITKDYSVMTLNVCFPYSATDEISSAIRKVVEDVEAGKLSTSDIDERTLESRLQIPGPDLDILVRTSGEIRFSNYMLWQSAKMAYIQFVDVYWPEFSFFHMFKILISWQMASKKIKEKKIQMDSKPTQL
ncbi:cis-prenyltransferase [Coemansia spiralis]|uniref:Alkyl transferase n=2 Tax=Coemansia TaxID=4863 RepID=A0A9W8GAV0_9FUNG|nr:putative undecaprenyl diphosphate synthase-domain-containing protein [Coemansia spiralis]KAJ1995244.1 cis-prenyltransferase [Coemansia umbellata]KAJ2625644.1 cis-prenyltransferase [Coemansia sp. RSA 1358]KAJ2678464.1 cis-prenyltransferase [Coemansia spiralis]